MQSRESVINQKASLAVGGTDALTLSTIFTMFLSDVMQKLLEETARFALFPIAGALAIIRAGLAWRQAKLDKGKNGTLTAAGVETLTALAVTTAVIGGLAATALFSLISPVIFVVTMAAKALFHAGSALYSLYNSYRTSDVNERNALRNAARSHAVGAVALTLATIAIGFVMIAAKPIVAIVGVIAGLIGASYSLYKFLVNPKPKLADSYVAMPLLPEVANESTTNNATLHRAVGMQVLPQSKPAPVVAPVPQYSHAAFWDRQSQFAVVNKEKAKVITRSLSF